jgi:hypothetical protein
LQTVKTTMQTFRIAAFAALLLTTGCQGGGSSPAASAPVSPAASASKSCEQVCNSQYDSCMDRFAGVGGGPSLGRHQDDANADLGPNDVCPDQLKSCLKQCVP